MRPSLGDTHPQHGPQTSAAAPGPAGTLQTDAASRRLRLCRLCRDSLSELRGYTEAEDGAPTPGPSVISLLRAEELERLIAEVKVLDEATLKVGLCRAR